MNYDEDIYLSLDESIEKARVKKEGCMKLLAFLLVFSANAVSTDLNIPEGVNNEAAWNGYQMYLQYKPVLDKAFAVAKTGAWGWSGNEFEALENCEKHGSPCKVISRGGKVQTELQDSTGFLKVFPIRDDFPGQIKRWKTVDKYRTKYLPLVGNKAFAMSESGAWAYLSGYVNRETVVNEALKRCEKNNKDSRNPCKILDVNNHVNGPVISFSSQQMVFDQYPVDVPKHWVKSFMAQDMRKYQALSGNKAIAMSKSGGWNWAHGYTTSEAAESKALAACERTHDTQHACIVVMVNEVLVSQ